MFPSVLSDTNKLPRWKRQFVTDNTVPVPFIYPVYNWQFCKANGHATDWPEIWTPPARTDQSVKTKLADELSASSGVRISPTHATVSQFVLDCSWTVLYCTK